MKIDLPSLQSIENIRGGSFIEIRSLILQSIENVEGGSFIDIRSIIMEGIEFE